jgi:hypothetical protein
LNHFKQALLGELSALNHKHHAATKSSPPRTKRVFVLAESSRSQTTSFIPLSSEKTTSAAKKLSSPTKIRGNKKDRSSCSINQVGTRSSDDATFLALLHLEPLVDRDLFRCARRH